MFKLSRLLKKKKAAEVVMNQFPETYLIPETSSVGVTHPEYIGAVVAEEHVAIKKITGHLEQLDVGRFAYSGDIQIIGKGSHLKIGRYTSIGTNNTYICGEGYHQWWRMSNFPFPLKPEYQAHGWGDLYPDDSFGKENLEIGNDVWIGNHVTVTKKVRIGNGAVIGIGSVVTKDVDDYAIVAGNPARVIRYRHDEQVVDLLKKLQWWNWSHEDILDQKELFSLEGEALKDKLEQLV